MKVIVVERNTERVEYEIDINDRGNIHQVFLETRGGRFEVSGRFELEVIATSGGFGIPTPRLVIRPIDINQIHLQVTS